MNAMTSSRSRSVGRVLAIMAICRPGTSCGSRAAHAVAEVRELPLDIGGVEARESRCLQRRITFGLAAMACTALALVEVVAVVQVAARGRCTRRSSEGSRHSWRLSRRPRRRASAVARARIWAPSASDLCVPRRSLRKLRSWRSRYAASWPAMAGALSVGITLALVAVASDARREQFRTIGGERSCAAHQ